MWLLMEKRPAPFPSVAILSRGLQQLGDELSKLGAADRAGVGHLRGEVFGDGAAGDGGAVRLGVSMMCPGRQTLSGCRSR